MDNREQLERPTRGGPTSPAVNGGTPGRVARDKTTGMDAVDPAAQKRFLVIRNGRGVLAHGDDMAELEREYVAASEAASQPERRERAGWLVHSWPAFASLARCDHEGETGKVCIIDSMDAPDAATSYYGMGFVD